ncbi:hypothetical protein ACJRO7_024812 [Eucalyptus globulus]|uniref:EF-hand domain-containing protein n=1 Tax=Eucalyptus globulus TaxID=34317 RepID=A0ABD3KAS5_EUCGL
MEELRAAAKVHYRDNAVFKRAVQTINDRIEFSFEDRVNYETFVTLIEESSRRCTSKALFRQLDRGEKGHLDRDDVRILYYLMDTRGDCSCCGDILRSVYYTCLPCFDNCKSPNNPTFNVCIACYRDKAFKHPQHKVFVDNYELLLKRRFQQLNWEELRQSAVQGAATGLLFGAIKEGFNEREAIADGLTETFGELLNQAPEAGVSELSGFDPSSGLVQEASSEAGNGVLDAFGDFIVSMFN